MSKKQSKGVILVTGASSGIGKASAESLIKEGYTVYGAARRVHLMEDLVKMGGHSIEMDVTDDGSVQAGVDRIIDEQGRIDGLFANAGYCLLGPVELLPSEEVMKQFDVNVVGVGRAISAVLPHIRKQGKGTIAICSSAAGHVGSPGMPWYPSTKFALQGLADGLRNELREFGINVVLIEPGYIKTGIDEASLPYLDMAEQHPSASAYATQIKNFRKTWSAGIINGASPDTIAKVVVRAFKRRRPRRRYHPNMDAKAAIIMKRYFGHGLMDRVITRMTIA